MAVQSRKPSARELRRAFGPRAVEAFDAHEHVIVQLSGRIITLEAKVAALSRKFLQEPFAVERHGEAVI